jgi:antirestriction protein ArdC
MNATVHTIVTQTIIEKLTSAIANGETIAPWCKPWATTGSNPTSGSTGKGYRGINWFILSLMGRANPFWFTFKQAKALGGSVRKGEKGTAVVFWAMIETIKDGKPKKQPLLRYYTVFNGEQCDNLPTKYATPTATVRAFQPIERAESVIAAWEGKPVIKHMGGRACYSPSSDTITMPVRESFNGNGEYYSTLFHECVHATGHPTRLAREEMGKGAFGSHEYSKEELTAEMGAAILASYCGIESTMGNSVSYLSHWLSKLKSEPTWLVSAAGKAQKAADMILGITAGQESTEASGEGEDS